MIIKALSALVVSLSLTHISAASVMSNFNSTTKVVEKELLVSFDAALSKNQKEDIIKAQGGKVIKHFETKNSALVKVSEFNGLLSTANALASYSNVIKISPNRVFKLFKTTSNDPKVKSQYHHARISSQKAWDVSVGTKEVVVAVIDTGIVADHEDLKGNIWQNPGETGIDADGVDKRMNGIDDDGNGYVDDYQGWDFVNNDNSPNDEHGHGTHCAGLIGAVGDNEIGIAGVNWTSSLVALKIFGRGGSATEASIVEAIEYSTKMGFPISNNSWGGPAGDEYGAGTNDLIYEAIKSGEESGQLFIFAAGNSSGNSDVKPMIPAAYDLKSIISVASSTQSDSLSGFSNYGAVTVDIAAPGSNILSTIKSGFFRRKYGNMSGTSMAAPIVTGAAALVKAVFPDATATEIKEKILDSADQIDRFKGKLLTGGRLNVEKAIQK